jgi:nucleotide-binding universal stress UspA family protein
MPGIIVGIDGSGHSRHALEWAIGEATARHAPLTVLAVQQAVVGYWGSPLLYPGDEDLAEQGRKSAQRSHRQALESPRPAGADHQQVALSAQVTRHAPCPVAVIPDENT